MYYKVGDYIENRYKVLEIIGGPGESGQGIVYVCVDEKYNNEIIALKTLQEELLDNQNLRNALKREALAWVQLGSHPFIVRALFVKNFDDFPYIGMEYIVPDEKGRNTLNDYLKKPVPLEKALKWSIQFCHGMEYSESKGIAPHRDIKPANIMITIDDMVKITDFTLVKFVEEQSRVKDWREMAETKGAKGMTFLRFSQEEVSGGTVPWMAPEQFDNKSCIESDIYSYGIVLYQMVNEGKLPYNFKTPAEYYYAHKMKTPPPINSKLYPIIEKCLNKKPEDRYNSFKELRTDLEQLYEKHTGKKAPVLPEAYELEASDHNNRGVSYYTLGFMKEAIEELNMALQINPSYTNAQINLAYLYRRNGKLDDAKHLLKNALKTNITQFKVYYFLGKIHEKKQNYRKALIDYEAVLKLQPHFLKIHNDLARVNEKLENFEDAMKYYENCLNFMESSEGAKLVKNKIKELKKQLKKR